LALRPRLMRDQLHSEDLLRCLDRVVDGLADLHTAAFSAASGVNLGFHYNKAAEFFGRGFSLLDGKSDFAFRHWHAVAGQNRLSLILVDFHTVNSEFNIVPDSNSAFLPFVHSLVREKTFQSDDAEQAMRLILSGVVSPVQLAAFLVLLPPRKVGAEVLLGFARAMREAMIRVDPGPGQVLDTCGTGGDELNTFNISTVAAFVVAGAGVKVAKHGNRSASSMCGSADVLEALGVNIDLTAEKMGAGIRETGIAFLFAPKLHPALRHAAPVRSELKIRTVFNLMGPLSNPAGAQAQLIGVPAEGIGDEMAQTLALLGSGRQILVHGSDGLDEITLSGSTTIWQVENGTVKKEFWQPSDFGLPRASLDSLRGGDRFANAAIANDILGGATGPKRDIVVMNAAAGLLVAGVADDLGAAVAKAKESIDSGAAAGKLAAMAAFSHA
jgi:anthranilate phosphoribosyltransferase